MGKYKLMSQSMLMSYDFIDHSLKWQRNFNFLVSLITNNDRVYFGYMDSVYKHTRGYRALIWSDAMSVCTNVSVPSWYIKILSIEISCLVVSCIVDIKEK